MKPESERAAGQVGAALRRIRMGRGVRQAQLARMAGVTRVMVCRFERGHVCPTVPTLAKMLRSLDCTAEEFGRHLGAWGCA
jgi:transcriptional regulator with XRE-family HTH domain